MNIHYFLVHLERRGREKSEMKQIKNNGFRPSKGVNTHERKGIVLHKRIFFLCFFLIIVYCSMCRFYFFFFCRTVSRNEKRFFFSLFFFLVDLKRGHIPPDYHFLSQVRGKNNNCRHKHQIVHEYVTKDRKIHFSFFSFKEMTFTAHPLTTTPLFGGALQIALPATLFRDVSEYFPLHDNQEVYQHISHPDCCFTVELLDRDIHRTDKETAVVVFEDLIQTEATTAVVGTMEVLNTYPKEEERSGRYPALFPACKEHATRECGDHTSSHTPTSAVQAASSSSPALHPSPPVGATTTKTIPPPCEYVCEMRGLKHTRGVKAPPTATTREAHTKGWMMDAQANGPPPKKENEKEGETKGVGSSGEKNEEEEEEGKHTVDRIFMALFRFTGTVNTDVVVSFVVPSTFSPSGEPSSTSSSSSSSSFVPSAEEQWIWNQALQSFCVLDWNIFL